MFKGKTKVFPFIIDTITDKRDNSFSVFKELKCSGLAFAELGKIGYKIEFNDELTEKEYEDNPELVTTLQYWLDKTFPNKKDENGNIIEWLSPWCYEVRMDWSYYSDYHREPTKVYDETYVASWEIDADNMKLIPTGTIEGLERARRMECYNSNKYNITQELAETFGVFCHYEYECDINGHFIDQYTDENGLVWTGRKVIFYNQVISLNKPLYIDYQKNLQTITRTSDSSELYTKLYVKPIQAEEMENGYVTIADAEANPSLDDFILNFDYLEEIGAISDYQAEFARTYLAATRLINTYLMQDAPIIDDLVIEINEQTARAAGFEKTISSAQEQLVYYQRLRDNELTNGTVIKDKTNVCSVVFVPDGTLYKAALRFEGIVGNTISGYLDNEYEELLFSSDELVSITSIDQVTDPNSFYVLVDEYGFPTALYTARAGLSVVYLALQYSPANKYSAICAALETTIMQNTMRKQFSDSRTEELQAKLDELQEAYNAKLEEKEELNRKFEQVMGPALREGYWNPEEQGDYGTPYEYTFTSPKTEEAPIDTSFYFDREPFENEQLAYYYYDPLVMEKHYYPYYLIDNMVNVWKDKDLDDLIIHLQRDFEGEVQESTPLSPGNYFFFCHNKKYYFTLEEGMLQVGDKLIVSVVGNNTTLSINGIQILPTYDYLPNANINLTSFFEDSTNSLADYCLYNNAGFVFAFLDRGNGDCRPVLLFNNDELLTVYPNYKRLAYSFAGENNIIPMDGWLIENTDRFELCYPRFYIAENNVFSFQDTLKLSIINGEELTELRKYYDFAVLLRGGKVYVTLKITGDNPFWKVISTTDKYQLNYRTSRANEQLYLDAKEVARDSSHPKLSYDLQVAILPEVDEGLAAFGSRSRLQQTDNKKMPFVELGQLAYINDPILGARAATGYVSEVVFVLEKPQEDSIKIQNYKTKFEDLFETITASSEAMKNKELSYDIAAGSFNPKGGITGDVLQTTLNNNEIALNYSATGVQITPMDGIILTNQKPYTNGVYGQIVLQGGGIFVSNSIDAETGERIWNTGITPQGINASLINAGQINTNLIKIFAGEEMAFQWNSEGIYAYKFNDEGLALNNEYIKYSQEGIHYTIETVNEDGTRGNPLHLVSIDWNGLTLKNHEGDTTLQMDAETGNVRLSGTIQSFNYHPGFIGSGWCIDEDGVAEFNDVYVRGTISAAVFKYDETTAVGGSIYVAPTIILTQDQTQYATMELIGDKLIISVDSPFAGKDDTNLAGRSWNEGDLLGLNGIIVNAANPGLRYEMKNLRVSVVELEDENGKIILQSEATVTGNSTNVFYNENGVIVPINSIEGGLAAYKGTESWNLIFLGSEGLRSGILITAMEESGPYIDILEDESEANKAPRARLGELSGLQMYDSVIEMYPDISGYGLYSDNVYLKGAIYATSGRIGSLSIDEVEDLPNTIDGVSSAIGAITTTDKTGKIIISKGALTADSISAGIITGDHIASDTITAANIATDAITANEIAAGAITTDKIASNFDLEIGANRSINITAGGSFTLSSDNFTVDSDGNVSLTGIINAKEGTIGGWTIKEGYLTSGDLTNTVVLSSTSNDSYVFWAGAEDPTEAPFRLTKWGNLWAGDATISGTITADDGLIGGWNIGAELLYAGDGDNYVALNTSTTVNSEYAIWAGNTVPANADFAVKKDGTVYLKKLIALGEPDAAGNQKETQVNLSNQPYWAIMPAYRGAIKSYDSSTGTITTYGGTTINFKKATSVGTDGNGSVYPIDASGNKINGSTSVAVLAEKPETAEELTVSSENPRQGTVFFDILLDDVTIRRDYITVNATSAYNAGANSVGVNSISNVYYNWINMGGGRYQTTVTFDVVLSNGKIIPRSVSVDHTIT